MMGIFYDTDVESIMVCIVQASESVEQAIAWAIKEHGKHNYYAANLEL